MVKLYFLSAIRNFQKDKSTFLINLIGLTTGLVCMLLIYLWVIDEYKVDAFHKDGSQIFRVMEHQRYANGNIFTTTSTPGILAAELVKEFPEVESAITISWDWTHLLSVDDTYFKVGGLYADKDFFRIFSFELVEGDAGTVLGDKKSIVISESVAQRLFGKRSAIGQMVEVERSEYYRVSGVFANPPSQSSLDFDFILNFEILRQSEQWLRDWSSNGPRTIVKLQKTADVDFLNAKISDFIKQRHEGSVVDLFLHAFEKDYLQGKFKEGKQQGGRIEYVRLFSVVAVFILVIACINFMNLSTAKASRKAKEIGIRKAIGAQRSSLIKQFIIESTLLALLALLLALLIIPIILPYFNDLTGKELVLSFTSQLIFSLIIIVLITGVLAGSYPALYLSSFLPSKVMRNDIKSSNGELWARKGLVIFQFALSVFLMVGVAVIYSQIQFVQNQNLGYDKENLLSFSLEGKLKEDYQAFRNVLEANPAIISTGVSGHTFSGTSSNTSSVHWPGKSEDEVVLFEVMRSDEKLIPTMGMKILEGRNFSKEFSTDSSAIIINEKALKIMGLEDPVNETINLWGDDAKIIGIVEDFHFASLHQEVAPAIFTLNEHVWRIFVRVKGEDINKTLVFIKETYDQFNPGYSFDYRFQDQFYERLYRSEQRVATLSQYFAAFAILISCLGLFGLASFTAERRIKEIGIRKVLGASTSGLIALMSKDFAKLVLVAVVIALPLSYLAVKDWLSRFAYQTDLSIWFFLLAGLLALLIALVTVSSQAYRAANVNPTHCLKDE